MIGFLPSIYPDELVYSWFCRCFVHSGYPTNKAFLGGLLFNRHCNPSKEFVGHLNPEMEQEIIKINPMKELVLEHTMFPQYARFLEPESKKNALHRLTNDFCDAHHLFSILTRDEGDQYLKYCPLCMVEDRKIYGEAYWHRSHQIRNMSVCTKHRCRLENSVVAAKSSQSFILEPAEIVLEEKEPDGNVDTLAVQFASYMEEIFESPMSFEEDTPISAILYSGMEGTKYLKSTGRVRNTQLLADDMQDCFKEIHTSDIASIYQVQRTLLGQRTDFSIVTQIAFFLGIPAQELLHPELSEEQMKKSQDARCPKGDIPEDWDSYDERMLPVISRKKGVLYGNGNILGYRLVKGSKSSENTYEIIEEDAETVRMVYDFYLEGMGVKTIAAKMQELHRQTAKSGCKWDATKVLRILDNKTYAGYIGYHKSHTASFLDHTRVPVRDRSQYEYVKGDFPAIIPEEKWNRVQSLKQKKVTCAGQGKYGKKRSKDRWVRVLVCGCGRTYHKYKWRVNKSGEECCGYQCWNQVNNRKKSYRIKNGLDAEGYCDVPSICEWKLDFMLKHILQKIWKNPKETITVLTETIKENYVEGQETNTELGCLKRELERLKCRKERLLDMRLDNQIEESAFEEKRRQIQERTTEIEKRLEASIGQEVTESTEDISSAIRKVKDVLENACNLKQKKIDGNLIEALVERVTPTEEGVFKCYLNCKATEDATFDEKEYTFYDSFCLCFEEAKAYRKQYGNFIRANQWRDLQVEIFIAK